MNLYKETFNLIKDFKLNINGIKSINWKKIFIEGRKKLNITVKFPTKKREIKG
tara:strand:- start:3276 stop:3434 length:159 start_codon:yes stop_codon:yes gene_type:complete